MFSSLWKTCVLPPLPPNSSLTAVLILEARRFSLICFPESSSYGKPHEGSHQPSRPDTSYTFWVLYTVGIAVAATHPSGTLLRPPLSWCPSNILPFIALTLTVHPPDSQLMHNSAALAKVNLAGTQGINSFNKCFCEGVGGTRRCQALREEMEMPRMTSLSLMLCSRLHSSGAARHIFSVKRSWMMDLRFFAGNLRCLLLKWMGMVSGDGKGWGLAQRNCDGLITESELWMPWMLNADRVVNSCAF